MLPGPDDRTARKTGRERGASPKLRKASCEPRPRYEPARARWGARRPAAAGARRERAASHGAAAGRTTAPQGGGARRKPARGAPAPRRKPCALRPAGLRRDPGALRARVLSGAGWLAVAGMAPRRGRSARTTPRRGAGGLGGAFRPPGILQPVHATAVTARDRSKRRDSRCGMRAQAAGAAARPLALYAPGRAARPWWPWRACRAGWRDGCGDGLARPLRAPAVRLRTARRAAGGLRSRRASCLARAGCQPPCEHRGDDHAGRGGANGGGCRGAPLRARRPPGEHRRRGGAGLGRRGERGLPRGAADGWRKPRAAEAARPGARGGSHAPPRQRGLPRGVPGRR